MNSTAALNAGAPLSTSRSASRDAIRELAVRAMFPCLVIGPIIAYQQDENLVFVGQAIQSMAIFAAMVIVLALQCAPRIFLFTVCSIVAFRVARIVLGESTALLVGYELAAAFLFATAGAAIFIHRLNVLDRQIKLFIFVSVFLMLFQVSGGPSWIHSLRQDPGPDEIGAIGIGGLLFLTESHEQLTNMSFRPAGISHSAAFFSMIVMPILAIHFSRWRGRNLRFTDILVAILLALAMSKIQFLAFLALAVVYILFESTENRWRMAKLSAVFIGMIVVYSVVLPVHFEYNFSVVRAILNFNLRLAHIIAVLEGNPITQAEVEFGGEAVKSSVETETGITGYGVLANYWAIALAVFLVVGPLILVKLRQVRKLRPEWFGLCRNGVLVALLAPLLQSFLGTPLVSSWAGGFLLMPFLLRKAARRLPRKVSSPRVDSSR